MALTEADRERVYRGLMRWWSNVHDTYPLSKAELLAAVVATDNWIDANQAGFNSALPQSARDGLSLAQKTLMFCVVAVARVSITFLRRLIGEVD